MKNRKGFTLIELLATILIVGIVVSLGTYLILNSIKNSKENALELSEKSVLESAVIYANEFLDNTDWVPSNEEINVEKSCINIQWLINKGYAKKEDFNYNNEDNKYKLNASDIAVIKKDIVSKNISYDKVYKNGDIEEGTCNNLLNAEIISTSSSTQSINISAKCVIKNIIQKNVTYEYCKENECISSNKNEYSWEKLDHNTSFNISVKCISDEFGESEIKTATVKTQELPIPIIKVEFTNATINYKNSDNRIKKQYKVDGSGIKSSDDRTSDLEINKNYETQKRQIILYGDSIEKDVTITAVNSDGHNSLSKTAVINKPETINVVPPVFESSDEIESGSWHNSDFSLSLTSNNNDNVIYYYGLSPSEVTNKYRNSIPITNETKTTTYYAKACLKDNCSTTTSYTVKLDKTAPVIDIDMMSTNDNTLLGSYSTNTSDVSDIINIINKKVSFIIKPTDLVSGINKTVVFSYNKAESTSYGSLTGSKNITLNNSNNGSVNITQDGYRYFRFEICDIAKNCSIKDIKVKIDTTPPSVNTSIGYTNVSGSILNLSCTGNSCTNSDWLNKYVTLYFNASDLISGLNNNAIFKYNNAYGSSLDTTLLNINESVTFVNGSWSRNITGDGNRYVTLKVCDNVNNCITKEVYFKIDTMAPEVSFLGKTSDNHYRFECSSLSGTKIFQTADNNGDKVSYNDGTSLISHWNNSSAPTINVTCRSNADIYANYTYKTVCTNESTSYQYCCYSDKKTWYVNGSSINNLCASTEKVYCNNIYKSRYTNCHTGGIYILPTTNEEVSALNYREWSNCKKTLSSTECNDIFEFRDSGKD